MNANENPLLDRNWDLLIILDACRYDTFAKINWLPGKLSKRKSFATSTADWVKGFSFVPFGDAQEMVYISGNPNTSPLMIMHYGTTNPFKVIDQVWSHDWDKEHGTVLPSAINNQLWHYFGGPYRLVAHYMQPHMPFIGKFRLPGGRWDKQRRAVVDKNELDRVLSNREGGNLSFYEDNSKEDILRAYESNLAKVIGDIEKVVKVFSKAGKKVVITSDHGEAFGEDGVYMHPDQTYIPALVDVPHFLYGAEV